MKGEIMQQKIIFDIVLPIHHGSKLKHIKEKSCYDSNYYQLKPYGDWVDFGRDNNSILHQKYHECANCYTYTFGHFEGDRFISAFGYTCDEDILDGIDIE
jgi:hypothetical protein